MSKGDSYEEEMDRARKYAQPNPKSPWAVTPERLKAADKRRSESEMRTINVKHESLKDKLGKRGRKS